MAFIFRANGTVEVVDPANGTDFTLAEMQKAVGGMIERVAAKDGRSLWCDEEGKRKPGAKANAAGTTIARAMGRNDVIVGDVLLTDPGEVR